MLSKTLKIFYLKLREQNNNNIYRLCKKSKYEI